MPDVRRRSGRTPNYGMRHGCERVDVAARRAAGLAGGDLAAVERAIAALEAQRSVLGDEVVETALAPLRERQAQLVSGQRGEQRKLVSVLFADLVDFTVLSRQLDPEDTRSVVDACFARWQAAIEAHGGVVEKFIGDAVMAVFGLHRSYEDDAERAVRAGLAMTAATAELSDEVERRFGVTPRMRVGVDTGEVVVSTLGERAGHDFVAVGPTVNRAARLQSAAPVGGVLISTETYRQVRRAFNVHTVPGARAQGPRRARRRLPRGLGTSAGIPARPARRRRGHRGEHRRPGRRDPVPPGTLPRRRRRGALPRRRHRRGRGHRQEPAAARLRPLARGPAAGGVVVPRPRVPRRAEPRELPHPRRHRHPDGDRRERPAGGRPREARGRVRHGLRGGRGGGTRRARRRALARVRPRDRRGGY